MSIQPGAYPPIEALTIRFTGSTLVAALIWFFWSRFSKEKVQFTRRLIWDLFL